MYACDNSRVSPICQVIFLLPFVVPCYHIIFWNSFINPWVSFQFEQRSVAFLLDFRNQVKNCQNPSSFLCLFSIPVFFVTLMSFSLSLSLSLSQNAIVFYIVTVYEQFYFDEKEKDIL